MKEIADQVHDLVQTCVKLGDIKVESAQDIEDDIGRIIRPIFWELQKVKSGLGELK